MGVGRREWFWLCRRCGESSLNILGFISAIASAKDVWVVDMWEGEGERGCWSPCSFGQCHDWDL